MKPKPKGILFRAEMIRALLNTKIGVWPPAPIDPAQPFKAQTRRTLDFEVVPDPARFEPFGSGGGFAPTSNSGKIGIFNCVAVYPKYPIGTILYAKETHHLGSNGAIHYRADFPVDGNPFNDDECGEDCSMVGEKWKPSIFMPMKAARLWFEVVKVRVERVNQITNEDAKLEGCFEPSLTKAFIVKPHHYLRENGGALTQCYENLWDSINGAGNFHQGPWVWVYDLKRINQPEGM